MNECNHIQKLIYPYLDGELDITKNLLVEEHIVQCQDCCDLLNEQKRFLSILSSASLPENGPPALKAKIRRMLDNEQQPWWTRMFESPLKLVVAGSFALFALVFIYIQGSNVADTKFAFLRAAALNHQELLKGNLSLQVIDNDPAAVSQWLKERLDFVPDFPRFNDKTVAIKGAGITTFGDRQVGFVSYEVDRTPVTLLIAPKVVDTNINSDQYTYFGERRINFSNQLGFNTVSWSVCSTNFALVSDLPSKGTKGCNVCHARGSGLTDLSSFYSSV